MDNLTEDDIIELNSADEIQYLSFRFTLICDRCLNYFQEEEKLERHLVICVNQYQIEMPDEDNKWFLSLKNIRMN